MLTARAEDFKSVIKLIDFGLEMMIDYIIFCTRFDFLMEVEVLYVNDSNVRGIMIKE